MARKPLLVGAAAVGILFPQVLWVTDFLACCLGLPLTDMTAYMFDPNLAMFYRGLSLFHGWLPFPLLYLVWKLGYDRRSLILWTGIVETLMLICYFFMPEPGQLERIAGTTNPPLLTTFLA